LLPWSKLPVCQASSDAASLNCSNPGIKLGSPALQADALPAELRKSGGKGKLEILD